MRRAVRPSAPWLVAAAGLGFVAGVAVMAASSRLTPPIVDVRPSPLDRPATVAAPPLAGAQPARPEPPPEPSREPPRIAADPIEDLRQRHLRLPVEGLDRDDLRDTFDEMRGEHKHEALDILAPRDTPVLAVEDGTIARLFLSKPGGITIYQFDPTAMYAYYYAHLSRYAEGLKEQARVERGQVIGYVGTTGNAPPDAPHLHFAIFKLTDAKRWWEGAAIDPYRVLR